MAKGKRAVVIVMDSAGCGELPDAAFMGDRGADTLGHIAEKMGDRLKLPNLKKLGIGNINGCLCGRYKTEEAIGSYGKLREISPGKDTISGHWELMGLELMEAFNTYPEGFPEDFIEAFEKEIGTEVLGNYAESGTVIIDRLGPEHEATGKPIVYTSADSVFQIAANIDVIPLEKLYEICEVARRLLTGDWACARVIARPYEIRDGKRIRTSDRHDYAVSPEEDTILDKIVESGKTVYAVGKINDIFNGHGITESVRTKDNMDGVDKTIEALGQDFEGMVFANLVDFDSKYGHRRDVEGYGKALMEFDGRIPEIIDALNDDDLLIITADHGNDPMHAGFDHTREFTPILVYGKNLKGNINLGMRNTFQDVGMTVADWLGVKFTCLGRSVIPEITE